jgi:hypothetical protein
MNAAEHIVACYLQNFWNCFVMTDVKVLKGNNRQCDILACQLAKPKRQYHVEVSVTHHKHWNPNEFDVHGIIDAKFLGIGKGSKSYKTAIEDTYRSVGLDLEKVIRVFVSWILPEKDIADRISREYKMSHGINVELWSLRDELLPEIIKDISTSNFDDEILRTLSLVKQLQRQRPNWLD